MKTCRNCNEKFQVFERDRIFYDKISPVFNGKTYKIPDPTICPSCRQQRRMSYRNERNLYQRKCDLCQKQIISMHSPDKPCTVFCQPCWWSDKWNGILYGRNYHPGRSFFEQYRDLQKVAPKIALLNVNAENSDYCNFTGDVKSSYLIFGSVYSEDCFYGSPYYSKDCVDTLVLRECELCYECVDCRKLYNCVYCHDCTNSSDLMFCYDCQNCKECVGCSGLRGKEYHFFNKPYSKEEYLGFKNKIDMCDPPHVSHLKKGLEQLKAQTPRKYMQNRQTENVSGDHVYNSKNTFYSFFADRCEDCSYCAQVVDMKDCFDCNYTEEDELCYEYLGMYAVKRAFFSLFCRQGADIFYSDYIVNASNCFGCSSLRDNGYCVLNKKYEKDEYEKLVSRILDNMAASGEFGEFPPIKHSLFDYNETVAHEYFPLTRESAVSWKEPDMREYQKPASNEILACADCGKNFRIIAQESAFYKKIHLPIPKLCPNCRHKNRLAMRNPRFLWTRNCSKCGEEILTSYPPDQSATPLSGGARLGGKIVYCEKCYLETMY